MKFGELLLRNEYWGVYDVLNIKVGDCKSVKMKAIFALLEYCEYDVIKFAGNNVQLDVSD